MKRLIPLYILALSACALPKTDATKIPVSTGTVTRIDTLQGRMVHLETNDSSVMYEITSVDVLNHNYYIRSRGRILMFDSAGHYLHDISRRGQGPGEYNGISSFFIKGGELYIYDFNQYALHIYDPQGTYLRKMQPNTGEMECRPGLVYPLGKEHFICRLAFRGTAAESPALAVSDDRFNLEYIVKGHNLTDASYFHDFLYPSKAEDDYLYWEAFNDTIYHIQDSTLMPKYIVDFQEHRIPESLREGKDLYDMVQELNKPENRHRFATMMRYVHEDEKNLYFIYLFKEENFLAVYHKKSGTVECYGLDKATQARYQIANFLKVTDNDIYFVLEPRENVEDNQTLFIVPKTVL